MSRILCVAVVLSALSGPAMAGISEGVAAATVGDYERAISEFKPLADAGDPAAQYQLARIYLEGRGPADGVPQGIALMTKAANGGYPEAQAQLGLMYAMGLGVEVDDVKAHDWLSKAINALPAGTRRTVAEANRDAVLKRMTASQQTQVTVANTAKPAETPAATQEAAKKSVTETTTAKATTTAKPAPTAAAITKATTPPPATTTKTVTEAAATNKAATTGAGAATAPKTATAAKPATIDAKTVEKAPETAPAKSPEKPVQVASAKAPEAASPDAQKAVQSGVRIQLVSMPSEEAAWNAWKQLSGKYSGQLTGLTAIVEPADLGDKGMFYRVQTGPFTTVAAAQERCSAMKEAGLDCLVVGKP